MPNFFIRTFEDTQVSEDYQQFTNCKLLYTHLFSLLVAISNARQLRDLEQVQLKFDVISFDFFGGCMQQIVTQPIASFLLRVYCFYHYQNTGINHKIEHAFSLQVVQKANKQAVRCRAKLPANYNLIRLISTKVYKK